MLDSIFDGMAEQIVSAFGDGVMICREEAWQGVKTPCFFLLLEESRLKPMLGGRKYAAHSFEVRYLPAAEDKNLEMDHAAGELSRALSLIPCDGGWIRGTDIRWERDGDELRFHVTYGFFFREEETKDMMELCDKIEVTLYH